MRSLLLLVGVVILSPTRASAEPAFLGIGLDSQPSTVGCRVQSITDDSAAQLAGVFTNDLIVSFAKAPIPDCPSLLAEIANHAPGEEIAVDVRRDTQRASLVVALSSRADITRRRMVGRKLDLPIFGDRFAGLDLDDEADPFSSLSIHQTTIAIVAGSTCSDGAYVSSKFAHRLRRQHAIKVLAIVAAPRVLSPLTPRSKEPNGERYDAPLAVADSHFVNDVMLIQDSRAHVMIIDRDGRVVHTQPVTTEQSLNELIDELVAAAELVERQGQR